MRLLGGTFNFYRPSKEEISRLINTRLRMFRMEISMNFPLQVLRKALRDHLAKWVL